MSEWKEYKLGDIAEILDYRRKPLSSMERNTRKGVFPYYGASGIIDNINDYLFEGEHVLISEDGENLRTRQTPIAFMANGKFWVNNHVHIVKSDFVHNRLICYYFAQLDLNPYITGAVQPKLSQDSLNKIPIYLPTSIDERKRIVWVLSSLDDKIDLLNRENATLEALAETLFRHYFIENPDPTWKEMPVSYYGKVICGKTPSKKNTEYFGGEVPFIKIPDMHGKTYVFNSEDSLTEKGRISQREKTLPKDSIMVSCIATVGLVSMNAYEAQTNQQINSVVPYNEHYRYYLYCWFKSMYDELNTMASGGTATLNLNTGDFSRIGIPLPDETTLKEFHLQVEQLFAKIKFNQKQMQTLAIQRDTLLPRLMSGEVKVVGQ